MPAFSPLEEYYRDLEAKWTVEDRVADYARLVVPSGNSSESFHRWFHLKEAFSASLLSRLMKDLGWDSSNLAVYDPFLGSATSALSALDWGAVNGRTVHASGVETNPFIATVAEAKLAGSVDPEIGARLQRAIGPAVTAFETYRGLPFSTPSTTLMDNRYFPPSHARDLLALGRAVSEVDDLAARAILQTCVAACVEPASTLRRDGRALRHMPSKTPINPVSNFARKFAMCMEDIQGRAEPSGTATVIRGDSRDVVNSSSSLSNWILTSPPYPNNIDYTEVYKLEAWVLGLWRSAGDMRRQRHATIRSHPSVAFDRANAFERRPDAGQIQSLLGPILDAVPVDRYRRQRLRTIVGYADDMLQVFTRCRALTTDDGYMAYVVGNSVHGGREDALVLAADLLLARLAEFGGWQVEVVFVARDLTRRAVSSRYARESVVVLRPA